MLDLTANQFKRAAAIKERLDALNSELSELLGGSPAPVRAGKRSRTMSAAVRKKIAAAQRKRWAKIKRK